LKSNFDHHAQDLARPVEYHTPNCLDPSGNQLVSQVLFGQELPILPLPAVSFSDDYHPTSGLELPDLRSRRYLESIAAKENQVWGISMWMGKLPPPCWCLRQLGEMSLSPGPPEESHGIGTGL
jgi:hypothetical protein